MADPKGKLDRLEAILGVDDTAELDRPEPRRGVGEILSGTPRTPAPPTEDTPSTASATPVREDAAAAKSPRRTPSRRNEAKAPEPKKKSSSLLPVELIERLGAARQRRWSFSGLLADALAARTPAERTVEQTLTRFDESMKGLYSYNLDLSIYDQLAKLEAAWRMNRSQVVTVLLTLHLDHLGL